MIQFTPNLRDENVVMQLSWRKNETKTTGNNNNDIASGENVVLFAFFCAFKQEIFLGSQSLSRLFHWLRSRRKFNAQI